MPGIERVHYNPFKRVAGYEYWLIGQLMQICYERSTVPTITVLADECLTRRPSGLELRNDYILKIRVAAQEWLPHEGTAESITKILLQRILDDTVADGEPGRFDYHRLTLNTVVAFDISHMLGQGLFDGRQ